MDLIQLFYFQAAARTGNITRAADQLHITQPALSKMIFNLENDLGVKLFDRECRRVHLNENGEIVLRYTTEILDQINAMRYELSDSKEIITGSIYIGLSFPFREPDPFSPILRRFLDDNPSVQVTYMRLNADKVVQSIRDRAVDIVITSFDIHTDDIVCKHLFKEKLGVIMSYNHRLAHKSSISVSELQDEVFYINNASDDIRNLTYSFCERAGYTPNVRFEGHFPQYIGESISNGKGVSFIEENQFYKQCTRDIEMGINLWARNIVFRPLKEDFCHRNCAYALLKKRYHSRAVMDFCRRLENTFIAED